MKKSFELNLSDRMSPENVSREKTEKSLDCKAEAFDFKNEDFKKIEEEIVNLNKANWGEEIGGDPDFSPEVIRNLLEDVNNIVVLLKTFRGKIIGYSIAIPDEDTPGSAYIYSTDIAPTFQNKGLVGKIMKIIEDEARKRGYAFITRDSAVSNGYADAIERHYSDRIVEKHNHNSRYGMQRYFKIKL